MQRCKRCLDYIDYPNAAKCPLPLNTRSTCVQHDGRRARPLPHSNCARSSLHSPARRLNLPVPPDYPLPYRTHRPITSPLPHSLALLAAPLAAATSQRTPRPSPSHVLFPNPSSPSHRYHGAESPTEGAPGPGSKWGGGGGGGNVEWTW